MKKNALIRIVYDEGKKKLRAKAPNGCWIRFPNALRVKGAQYRVERLAPGAAGS